MFNPDKYGGACDWENEVDCGERPICDECDKECRFNLMWSCKRPASSIFDVCKFFVAFLEKKCRINLFWQCLCKTERCIDIAACLARTFWLFGQNDYNVVIFFSIEEVVANRSQGENSLTWQTLFLAGGELNRWPCHSHTQWLSKVTFDFNFKHLQFLHCFYYPIISNYFHVCIEMLHVFEGCLFTLRLAPRQALQVTGQSLLLANLSWKTQR